MNVDFFKRITKNIPTMVTAILLALAVWVLAVTNIDPVEKRNISRPITIEMIGLGNDLIIANDYPDQVSLTLSAPSSVWNGSLSATTSIRAIADLTGLDAGSHNVPVKLQIDARPIRIDAFTPETITIVLEKLASKTIPIKLVQPSTPAIGFEAGPPTFSSTTAKVSGPASLVERVDEVRAVLDINQASEDINRDLVLSAYDENGGLISGVTISPEKVNLRMKITQRGGYRNVSVRVITTGKQADGYSLTSISSTPLVVTVYSTDPEAINKLPGYIETQPLNLTNASEDIEVNLPLNLPSGVIVVGDSTVKVSISISPIRGSRTFINLPVEIIGLLPEYEVRLSPDRVDVIFSGPLPTLEKLRASDIRVQIDLKDAESGVFQEEPQIEMTIQGLMVESILPGSIEVTLAPKASP